jgi:hypothetical protein
MKQAKMKIRILLAALPALAMLATAASAAPVIYPFGADGMARIGESQAGHPYVLMVWSLDCGYCHASIASLAAAQRQQGLGVVTLATDSASAAGNAEAIRATVAPLAPQAGAWAFGSLPPEQLRYAIDPKWHGELPRSYWYDAQGRQIAAHSGLITPELIARFRQP